ncbi:GNAT family N-acetyltransferase [Mycobacterium haemophilum DSM 44634]|nr:GNAT family N-acetyltransferase [Mycobacterium haemophilum DSM 44634]
MPQLDFVTATVPKTVPSALPTSLAVRSPSDDDWPAMYRLAAASFTEFIGADSTNALRTLIPDDGAVVACDGHDVVGMALYLDLRLTVPGGAVLPAAGLSFVAVAPTHRRRGTLRAMCAELHRRMADSGYPIAALYASEGGIYGRFGYGPATIVHELTIDRRFARFHADAPDPGAVRLIKPAEQGDQLAAIYERWRQQVPGGLARPQLLWDQLLDDNGTSRREARELFALLHPDGYALYRVDDADLRLARVCELRAVTTDAHVALWRALLGLDSMDRVSIITHGDDPLPYLLTDTRLARTTGRQDGLWLRIIDIPAALEARSYSAELGELATVLDVSERGRFALQIRNGRASCTPTDAPAEVEMGLDVLGSLYLGAHRASMFAAANRLRVKDFRLLRRLDAAFASDVTAEAGFEF